MEYGIWGTGRKKSGRRDLAYAVARATDYGPWRENCLSFCRGETSMFIFEKLEVYKKSMDFTEKTMIFTKKLNEKWIKDQLSRAALSVPINIAEGQGRTHLKEKRQFYWTARGSLCECIPLVQLCQRLGHLTDEDYSFLYELANEISKMLTGLIKSVEPDGRKEVF